MPSRDRQRSDSCRSFISDQQFDWLIGLLGRPVSFWVGFVALFCRTLIKIIIWIYLIWMLIVVGGWVLK